MTKHKTSFALSDEGMRLLRAIAEKYAVSMTAILEIIVREKAIKEGVKKDDAPPSSRGNTAV